MMGVTLQSKGRIYIVLISYSLFVFAFVGYSCNPVSAYISLDIIDGSWKWTDNLSIGIIYH
jgi:hypothetical protein